MATAEGRIVEVFRLIRSIEEKEENVIAYGSLFPNGKAVLAWHTEDQPQSVSVWRCLDDLLAVHLHSNTRIEWLWRKTWTERVQDES